MSRVCLYAKLAYTFRAKNFGRMQLKVQEAMRKKEKFQREHEEVSFIVAGDLSRRC